LYLTQANKYLDNLLDGLTLTITIH